MYGLRARTDFAKDVVEYGPIGENKLKMILEEKGHRYADISNDERFRIFDIDILQFNDAVTTASDVLNAYHYNRSAKDVNAVSYEVKTDTYGRISRNIVYEDISNSSSGCMARTRADYLYYVFIDENKVIVEEFLIEVRKLRRWLMENFEKINRCDYLKSKSMRRGADNTAIFLINIEKLIEEKVATKI